MKIDEMVNKKFLGLEKSGNRIHVTLSASSKRESINYEEFHEWGTGVINLLQFAFGSDSVHFQVFLDQYKKYTGYVSQLEVCRGIFNAAKDDYRDGYLSNVRSMIKAEILSDDILGQAKELLKNSYKDPACILAGVALEVTLKEMYTKISTEHKNLEGMNMDLCKAGKYHTVKHKQIAKWADLRNKAAHGEWTEYNQADVDDFIKGVERFIADFI